MTDHPFDQAMALSVVGDPSEGRFEGLPSAYYWNMVGPYGGITAATVVKALLQHPQPLGQRGLEPLKLGERRGFLMPLHQRLRLAERRGFVVPLRQRLPLAERRGLFVPLRQRLEFAERPCLL